MTMRNFPPFANLYYYYCHIRFYNFLFATRFVLLVQSFSDVTWGANINININIYFFLTQKNIGLLQQAVIPQIFSVL